MRNFLKKSVVVVMAAAACLTVSVGSYIEKPVSALTVIADINDVTAEKNVISVGESTQLSVDWDYGGTLGAYIYSSDESIVKVENASENGCTLTGVGAGTAEITVNNTPYSKTVEVEVVSREDPIPLPTEPTVFAEPWCFIEIASPPAKTEYRIGEELDLSGLTVDLNYARGGEIPESELNKYSTVMDDVNPLEDPETFIVDTSGFDADKAGEYKITISLTREVTDKLYYCYCSDVSISITVSENSVKGDVNTDGEFNVADVVALQKWLLGNNVELKNWKAADLCEDDKLDVFDLCLMKRELINSGIVESPLLTIEREHYIPGENGYETVYETKNLYESNIEDVDDLKAVKNFVANASDYKDCEMTDIGLGIDDYGLDTLKAYYIDENGIRQELILCEFGGMCRWLDNKNVQDFVEMLIEKEYFADKDIFEWYKNNHSTNEKITWEIAPIANSDKFRDTLDKEYIITSTKELVDYFFSIYGDIIDCDVVCPENVAVNKFFNKYDYKFFENNILLMKPFYQFHSNGNFPYAIEDVMYSGDTLCVYYTDNTYGDCIEVFNPYLALVTVPKALYHAENVMWINVTIGFDGITEIKDGYIAVFHGIADDLMNETYIYKIDNGAANYGFEYINVSRSSFGIDHTERVTITGQGSVMWTDNVFQVAEANDAYDYVTVPNDETRYTIDEFMVKFLMD